jgi:pimeloyl-ACP methyl ester carboxylesterase
MSTRDSSTPHTRKRHTLVLSVALTAALGACGGGDDDAPAPQPQALTCDDSMKAAFKPDANTSVLQVKQFKKGETPFNPTLAGPAQAFENDVCFVKILVGPGNPGPASAPSTSAGIGVEVWLPAKDRWNGRYHATGNGGWGGTSESVVGKNSEAGFGGDRPAFLIADMEGAVTSSDNMGHLSAFSVPLLDASFAMSPDGTINKVLWEDFSNRAIHEHAVKAKALATAYYGSAPKFSYFEGGSTGGRQALKLAQNYPNDFDGIIALAPAINWSKFITAELYPQIVIQRDLGGNYMTPGQLDLVSNAAINACDLIGGQHLGYIVDPSTCIYDPMTDPAVLCTGSGGTNATAECVTTAQAAAINKMWYGMTADGTAPSPAADLGWELNPSGNHRWYGLARGTSLLGLASPAQFPIASEQVALELQNSTLAGAFFSNATGNGADGWKSLSYAQLSNAFDRGLALQPAFANINTDNPDLSAFKARGGKLLHVHGIADTLIFPQGSIDYYNKVLTTMGGAGAVDSFYKMYLVPAMGHGNINGTSNAAANPPLFGTVQLYELITNLVETNAAPPDRIDLAGRLPAPAQSAPVCAYPKKRTYVSGDILVAASYTCL